MCGLAAVPVGDLEYPLVAINETLNATWPTSDSRWKGDKIIVEYVKGQADREYVTSDTGTLYGRDPTRTWGQYIPGIEIVAPSNYYFPFYEWKVVPEEMPLLWMGPMACFLSGVLVMLGSYFRSANLLVVAIVCVSIAASLVLLSSHRIVELTYFCSECDSLTKYMSEDGLSLGTLPDSTEDPDFFADNNCPHTIHLKCEQGRNAYLGGGVINLICMYLMFIGIELRRNSLTRVSLASQDETSK